MPIKITDETIEEASDALLAGKPLTREQRRLLESTQGDFASGQIDVFLRSADSEPADAQNRR